MTRGVACSAGDAARSECPTLNGLRERSGNSWRLWNRISLAKAAFLTLSWKTASAFLPEAGLDCGMKEPIVLFRMSTLAEPDVDHDRPRTLEYNGMTTELKSDSGRVLRTKRGSGLHKRRSLQNGTTVPHSSQFTDNSSVYFDSVEKRVQFKGLSTGANSLKLRRTKPKISERQGRVLSSTMPGFGVESDRLRAHREGIRLAEVKSGRLIGHVPEKESQRKRQYGESLYKNSGAVPDSLVQFADDIHQEERISRKEEIELGELTQEAVRLQQLYDHLKDNLQREPTDNEWCAAAGKINMMAIEQAIEDGFEAKNRLVASNLRMVQSVVNTYLRNGLSAQYNAGDMMQEGILALIRAAEKFEPDRGWKFSTYAMYWVRASVKRSQVAQSRPVPVPHRVYENHKRLLRTQRKLEISLTRRPTKKELGDAVGMSELQVDRCFKAMQQKFYSLDQEIRNTKKPLVANARNDRLVEIVEARVVDDEFSLNAVSLREAFVETLRRHLNEQEVELLMLRYGLKDCPEHGKVGGQPTIAELSRFLGLTPDKVRRIIKRALQHLKEVDPQEWLVFKEELC